MGGSPDINYPAQPTYGEGMADALKAQVELLTGQGDFAEIAPEGLAGLLPLEEDIRRTTAQTDTDILRQTLLGSERKVQVELDPDTGKYGIPGAEVVTDEEGEPQVAGGGRFQMVTLAQGEEPEELEGGQQGQFLPGRTPTVAIIDTDTGGISSTIGGEFFIREGQNLFALQQVAPVDEISTLDADIGLHLRGYAKGGNAACYLLQDDGKWEINPIWKVKFDIE